jgi:hypothetical protein
MRIDIRILFSAIISTSLILTGCTKNIITPTELSHISSEKIDAETIQKIDKILDRIRNMALKHQLEYVGRNTMVEAVQIMDIGSSASVVLIGRLKTADNWKFRFWIVDLMGYIPSRDNILPLIEIVEDPREKEIIRVRACESLKELNYKKSLEQLLISMDIVENPVIRETIRKTVGYIRK